MGIVGPAWFSSGEGPYTITAAVAAVVALVIVIWVELIKPWLHRRKLLEPCEARFVIRGLQHAQLDHLIQDDERHIVDELVLPSRSVVEIEFGYIPKVPIYLEQLIFGCEGDPESKPFVIEALDRFSAAGETRSAPGDHSCDIHKHWHIVRNVPRSVGTHYVVTFKLQTGSAGVYPVSVAFVTNEIEGNAKLRIRVEDKPMTRMRCRATGHSGCLVRPVAVQR